MHKLKIMMLIFAGLTCLGASGAIIAYMIKTPTLPQDGFEG